MLRLKRINVCDLAGNRLYLKELLMVDEFIIEPDIIVKMVDKGRFEGKTEDGHVYGTISCDENTLVYCSDIYFTVNL